MHPYIRYPPVLQTKMLFTVSKPKLPINFYYYYWKLLFFGFSFWLFSLVLSIKLAKNIRYVNVLNPNMLSKRSNPSIDWPFPFKFLSSITLYILMFDPWFSILTLREEFSNTLTTWSSIIAQLTVKRTSLYISIFYCCLYKLMIVVYNLMLKMMVQFFVLSYSVMHDKVIINSNFLGIVYCSFSLFYLFSKWLILIKIILSNDIETNPGDLSNGFFTFCNWNLNSLAKDDFYRIRLLEAHNSISNYDIISICETSLNDTVTLPDVMLENYSFIPSKNPGNSRHGGVGLFYKNSLPVKVRDDLSFNETIVLELKFGRKKIFFTVLYRSPAYNLGSPQFENFLLNLRNLYESIKNENPYTTFFTGDFNGHSQLWWNQGGSNPEGREIEELMSLLGLTQLISEPTNFEPNKNPSCIDLIFTDQPNIVIDSGTKPSLDNYCHHQIIYCRMNFNIPPPPPFHRKIWKYARADVRLIKRAISDYPWRFRLNSNPDPNWQVTLFTETILNIMSNFIPNEIIKVTPKDPPWITKPLKTLLNRQCRLYKNYKKHGYKPEDKIRVDNFNAECMVAISKAKETYLDNIGDQLADPNTTQKTYWKILNKIMNKCKAPKIPPLLVNNRFIINCKEKATKFGKFFSEQCSPLINNSTLPNFIYTTNARLDSIVISEVEIITLIRNLNIGKACGPDGISAHMLLICDETISIPLKIIFESIFSTGIYPELWKSANVSPIHKKSDKQLINNYRPISLLPICSKLLEKIIFNQLYSFFNDNNLITKNQSGFRAGDSTTNQLIELVNDIHKSFDNRCSFEVRSIFLDISKAFDKVWHEGLIFKLKQNGVCGPLIKLLVNYLKNRKQKVVINGSSSNYFQIKSGVPQGSVLGPLLFLIYINDLEKQIISKIKFFADDTMIFSVVHDPRRTAYELNKDLQTISTWAHQWKLSFNPDINKQAVEVLFSHKIKKSIHPPIFFNDAEVIRVNEHKHLGLILDSKLSFSQHVNEKIKIARKSLGVIKYLSSYLPIKTLELIYKLYIRPHFDYCDVIYHIPNIHDMYTSANSLHTLMESIERIQYHAALAITGTWQGSSRTKLYEELGWESLTDRRWLRRLIQFYKIHNNMTPQYLKNNIPPTRESRRGCNNRDVYHNILCNTTRYMNSFFPNAVKLWNNIGDDFHSCNSIEILKKNITNLIRPPSKSIYSIHDPKGLKYVFQLRIGLSPLKSHKKKYNFADTPIDWCDCNIAPEDTCHFLFHCKFYEVQRSDLLNAVIPLLLDHPNVYMLDNTDLFLYGHHSLEHNINKEILLSTIRFIKGTGRFNT